MKRKSAGIDECLDGKNIVKKPRRATSKRSSVSGLSQTKWGSIDKVNLWFKMETLTTLSKSGSRTSSPASPSSSGFYHSTQKIDNTGCSKGKYEAKRKECERCHQCMKKERRIVVQCANCEQKMYCIQCIKKWYPQMKEEDIALLCPFCRGNCNCSRCLHTGGIVKASKVSMSDDEKVKRLKYVMEALLPFLRQICEEQIQETQIEANIQGTPADEVEVPVSLCHNWERVYCDNCATSIVNIHRSCPECSFELCLNCCQETRMGKVSSRAEVKL